MWWHLLSWVSTPKTWSLADLSMTTHNTWWNPTISTIPTHAQTTPSNLTTVTSHHDGWKTNTLNSNTSQTQHHKDGKTSTSLKTAWLRITNQVWTQFLIMRFRYSIKACNPICILEKESTKVQYDQWSLALLSCWLLLKILEVELLKILKVFGA
jgi:hypothetical protein